MRPENARAMRGGARRYAAFALSVLAVAGCLPSFDAFEVVDGRDAGTEDDAGSNDAGLEDGGPPDGGEPPPTRLDYACPTEWVDLTPAAAAPCAGRRVVVAGEPVLETWAVALGRANDGTLTLAFHDADAESSTIETVRFHEDSPEDRTAGPTIEPESVLGDLPGISLAMATEAPDIHHLAYWYRSDFRDEVRYQTLRGDMLSEPFAVGSDVGPSGVVDVALDAAGRPAVAWRDEDSGAHTARRETADGSWSTAVNLRNDPFPELDGNGAIAIVGGATGVFHVASQWCLTLAASALSYTRSTTSGWSTSSTIDNTAVDNRASGVGADLALVGNDVVIAYLDWDGGAGEIRLARIAESLSEPTITRLIEGVVIPDRPGTHPIVLRADVLGRLHLVVADASSAGVILQYWRQTSVGGELRWIHDTIATFPGASTEAIPLDMVLGPDRRPHIVFRDPIRADIMYATLDPE